MTPPAVNRGNKIEEALGRREKEGRKRLCLLDILPRIESCFCKQKLLQKKKKSWLKKLVRKFYYASATVREEETFLNPPLLFSPFSL